MSLAPISQSTVLTRCSGITGQGENGPLKFAIACKINRLATIKRGAALALRSYKCLTLSKLNGIC